MYIMIKIVFFLIGLFYLKISISKVKKVYFFYRALNEYKFIQNEKILSLITPFLIVLELFVSLYFIFGIYSLREILLCVSLQFLYIFLNLRSLKNFNYDNCGCFPLQVPKKGSLKIIFFNISFLFFIIILFGVKVRLL
ncbi:MauE/DoxX family redox-associated membrane protein [Paenibacillus polymyxa]|jgi:hypothetical protein|uniref:MauE/DoxX family redox-associated membrane protein n=1 Tax=Paenibacillus TaxID=44249 RepID=UPI000496D96B